MTRAVMFRSSKRATTSGSAKNDTLVQKRLGLGDHGPEIDRGGQNQAGNKGIGHQRDDALEIIFLAAGHLLQARSTSHAAVDAISLLAMPNRRRAIILTHITIKKKTATGIASSKGDWNWGSQNDSVEGQAGSLHLGKIID